MRSRSREWWRTRYENDKRYGAGPDDFENPYSLRNWWGLRFETSRMIQFFTLLNEHKIALSGSRILDIGCHYGFYANLLAYLRRDTAGIHGVDFIAKSVEVARQINGEIAFAQGDIGGFTPEVQRGEIERGHRTGSVGWA